MTDTDSVCFDKSEYLNKEVQVLEEIKELTIGDRIYKIEVYRLSDNNSLIEEIKSKYNPVRVILPNSFITADYRISRLNLVISKTSDKFVITEIYFG